jgi:hypothetical protein
MAITKNYQSTPHIDRDLLYSMISWFLESNYSLPLCPFGTLHVVWEIVKLYTNTTIMNMIGVK